MGRKTWKQRSRLQREQDRQTISRMALQGKSQQEIANFLELDRSLVSREIKAVRQEWKAASLRDFDELKGRQLAELELVKAELWQAWEQSQAVQETTATEKTALSSGAGTKASGTKIRQLVRQQTKPGDLTFLSGIVTVVKEECKILGLYPQETTGGQTINLSEAQIDVIGQILGESNAVNP